MVVAVVVVDTDELRINAAITSRQFDDDTADLVKKYVNTRRPSWDVTDVVLAHQGGNTQVTVTAKGNVTTADLTNNLKKILGN